MIPRALVGALAELAEEAEEAGFARVRLRLDDVRRGLRDGSDGYQAAIAACEARADALDVGEHPELPVEIGDAARDAREFYLRALELLREHAAKEAA